MNFAVNIDIGDPANIKTAKIWTYTSPCSQAWVPATKIKILILKIANISVTLIFGCLKLITGRVIVIFLIKCYAIPKFWDIHTWSLGLIINHEYSKPQISKPRNSRDACT